MAEPDTRRRYPQATPDGEPIPFEIIRPLGLIPQGFSDVAVDAVAIPDAADYLILRATMPCYVQFLEGISAAVPADGSYTAGLVFVDEQEVVVIDHNAATEFSVIRAGEENGMLRVQCCTKYTDVRKSAQMDRA